MKLLVASLVIAGAITFAQTPKANDEPRRFRTEDRAYIIYPGEKLDLPEISEIQHLGPDLFIARRPGDASDIIVDLANKRIQPLPRSYRVQEDRFRFGRGNGVLLSVSDSTGVADTIFLVRNPFSMLALPGEDYVLGESGILARIDTDSVLILNNNGRVIRTINSPDDSFLSRITDREVLFYYRRDNQSHYRAINIQTGAGRDLASAEYRAESLANRTEKEAPVVDFKTDSIQIKDNLGLEVGLLWQILALNHYIAPYDGIPVPPEFLDLPSHPLLPHEKVEPLTIEVGAEEVLVSDDSNYLLVLKEASLYSRKVESISLADYEAFLREFYQSRAMNSARELQSGLSTYAADYDELLPMQEYWAYNLFPYLRDTSELSHIIYLHDGNNITDLKASGAALGYIETPYGRAISIAGAEPVWRPNP